MVIFSNLPVQSDTDVLPSSMVSAVRASLVDRVHRPSRRVSDVQDIDHVFAHAIENPERITHDGYDMDLRSLRDSRSRFRNAANAVDDIFQPSSDGISYRGACTGRVIGRIPSRSASARLE